MLAARVRNAQDITDIFEDRRPRMHARRIRRMRRDGRAHDVLQRHARPSCTRQGLAAGAILRAAAAAAAGAVPTAAAAATG
eukprot:2309757-Pleurochrysis_carterae.AAC.3